MKDLSKNLPDARYVRLINKKSSDVKLTINKFVVHSTEITAPYLYKTTMTVNPSWGVAEDSRNNGAAFDGNIDLQLNLVTFHKRVSILSMT